MTDDDISLLRGTRDELEGCLQRRYGYEKQEAKRSIDHFIEKNHWE